MWSIRLPKESPRRTHIVSICIVLAIAAIVGTLYAFDVVPTSETHRVTLTEEGFAPQKITIQKGDTVVFQTQKNTAFWPASDQHPEHAGYPETGLELCANDTKNSGRFDACEPISSDKNWSFTFNAVGTWSYHDHLTPEYKGTVIVKDRSAIQTANVGNAPEVCRERPKSSECFDAQVRAAVKNEGVNAAYELMERRFSEGELTKGCHDTSHVIGGAAYKLYKQGKEVPMTEATSYCGYGFYHEFLEHLLREDPYAIDKVFEFCDRVEKKLGRMGLWNCYHGIGHGHTQDPPNPENHGDFRAMTEPGIKVCENLFGEQFELLNLCLTGVFTVPVEFATREEAGLSLNEENVFKPCEQYQYRYQKACYGEFAAKLETILEHDLSRLPEYMEQANITDAKKRKLVTWVASSVMVIRNLTEGQEMTEHLIACQNDLPETDTLSDICIGGLIQGIASQGEPGKQHKALFRMCSSNVLTPENRELCYSESLRQLQRRYGQEKVKNICSEVPAEYRAYCTARDLGSPYKDPSFETREE